MGDENPIRTLGDYSKPSHEGYRNTIELPVGNNVVPLRSDTIRLVQNGCSFHGLRSEDPNQHLKDFLKLVDSLDLDGENRERTRLRLFQFSLRDQASNWLERLPAGSISTWEDLTTRFLAQFFPPGRTAKLRNDILMFQQHHGESLSEAWTRFKDLLQKVPHHGIDLWLQLRDLNPEESWAILEDLALYDNESWNDPRDFAKPVKEITLPQDVMSTSDCRLIELENQVQRLMEAYLASTQLTQVKKIIASCKICNGPHDTHNCTEGPEQACVDYASSHTNEIRDKKFISNQGPRNFNDVANTWKDNPNFNWERTQTFTNPQNESISIHSSSYLIKLEKALLDFDYNQEKSHGEKEELRKKGIKSPSKLFSLKYLSPTSIKELNKNPSALKLVHFVNSIVILSKDSDMEEEDTSSTNAHEHELDDMERRSKGIKEHGKEDDEIETDMEVEEVIGEEENESETDEEVEEAFEEEEEDEDDESLNSFLTMKELSNHEWLLKHPRPPWVKAKYGGDRRGIRHLMRLEKEMMDNKGEVT
ncbi:MAK10-like protein [Tanacetum coccineum]